VYGGGVSSDVAHEGVRVRDRRDVTQDLRQLGNPEFTRSTGAVTELGQTDPWPLIPGLVRHLLLVPGGNH